MISKTKKGYKVTVSSGSGIHRVRKSRNCRTLTEAKRWLNEMDSKKLKSNALSHSKSLLTDAFDVFVKKYKMDLAPATVASYEATLRMLEREIPDVQLGELSFSMLQTLFNRLQKQRGLSKATLKKYRTCLSAASDVFEKEGLIERNYARGIKLQSQVTKPDAGPNILSVTQYHQVVAHLTNMPIDEMKWFHVMMLIAFTTGLRSSEILDLRGDDVDFEQHTLRVDSAFCRVSKQSKVPKSSNSYRDVPVTVEFQEKLLAWQQRHLSDLQNPDDRLILNEQGQVPDQSCYAYHFKATLKTILGDCPEAKLSPHKARHTFISMMLSPAFGSLSVDFVAMMSGHSVATLNSTYRHLTSEEAGANTVKLTSALETLTKGAA
ncbi:site-specific integrase [Weissella viridescens]|uniref:tyrosine-type recombinase/integrase n=1 Tax=Weissella viridescens TaxID=1629 RepID=UPI001D086CDA|nr:tyrosine-type recombinase/integrase [Weissella viridescens]MCB6840618.1 site-specific integrase [Weissella viridescens]MCB6847274.1 site-specific integrase [Weissella viridescens]